MSIAVPNTVTVLRTDRTPACEPSLSSGYDGVVRLAWTLGPAGKAPPIEGGDVLVLPTARSRT